MMMIRMRIERYREEKEAKEEKNIVLVDRDTYVDVMSNTQCQRKTGRITTLFHN